MLHLLHRVFQELVVGWSAGLCCGLEVVEVAVVLEEVFVLLAASKYCSRNLLHFIVFPLCPACPQLAHTGFDRSEVHSVVKCRRAQCIHFGA